VGQIPTGSGDSITIVNYQPIYTIQQVSIQEAFSPLIGLNFAWKNGLTTSFDFKRTRNIQLNVGALQLAEMRNTEMTINLNWRKDKMLKPLRILGKNIELKNSLTARFELTLRDTRMQNRRLDSSIPEEPTGGNYSLTIKPSIDYVFSPQLTVRGYFERNVNRPVLSTSFPTSFTAVGVQARFTLTQ
jgi:cell surface protein SprA